MLLPKQNTPRWIIIIADLCLSLMALLVSYVIRFDLEANEELIRAEWAILSRSIGIYIGVKLVVFYLFKVHKGLIRHTSTEDFFRIFKANVISSALFVTLGLIRYYEFDGFYLFPTSVLITEFIISTLFIVGSRFAIKLIYLESVKSKAADKHVLIYGAGISGLITKRTIEKDLSIGYNIVGFLDDNRKMKGNRLEGQTIYHTDDLDKLMTEHTITDLIVAIQNPNEDHLNKVIEKALSKGVNVQKVPSVKSWINGEFSTKQLSKVKIEDLLGRKPIVLDEEMLSKELSGRIILVTGAAGSIGSGLVRQVAKYNPALIVLLDQAESPLYDLQNEIRTDFPKLNFELVIGDIRSEERMRNLFQTFKPEYVFHAAAYKHVPLMEENPSEAIHTNVKGTKNLVDLSNEFGVFKFVMVSTDKAVNPTNVMGASKRIAEIYAQSSNGKSKTKFITTRFGNVLGSNGSVIPLFQRQLDAGGPITVTDERITRYFMTIPEACMLVLEAGTMGEGGEIFVFDMGESVKIIDLAKKMIKLSGLELGKDIEIKITGLRPGEKLYEELLAKEENTLPTHHPKILRAKVRAEGPDTIKEIEELISMFEDQDNFAIVGKMKDIVPEFISNNSAFEKLDKK
ncbi:MAG: polysaccharide biosynthesis protein [Bacteroidetes bacterium]|nr:MAG: polysaccharide biosynthesis protein [Bacteroidota bacterium]